MLHCDYLIQGAGAMGLAAADELLTHSEASLLIVDRHHRPGGHWNLAYPFVKLHQPSAMYGVNSVPLGQGRIDETGLNRGLMELATGPEVLAYFERLVNERFLPSGRVQYLPMHECLPDGSVRSLLTGKTTPVRVRRKTLDARILNTQVPATRPPRYRIAEGQRCLPPHRLPELQRGGTAPDGFVVIGGGKTAMDVVLWLLEQAVPAAAIRWVVPRDSWLIDRANAQPSPERFMDAFGAVAAQLQAVAEATSMADLYRRLEAAGQLMRLDPAVEPTKYVCATVSRAELAELRRVAAAGGVVRLGHVQAIEADHIALEQGRIPTSPGTVHIDCSASALDLLPPQPVFQGERIALQMVRACQPVFSAALIAFVEATRPGAEHEALKNTLCQVVPMPGPGLMWLPMLAANMANQHRWSRDDFIGPWLLRSRLDTYSALARGVRPDEADKLALLERIKQLGAAARPRMQVLLGEKTAAA
jgi:hypothetical protein